MGISDHAQQQVEQVPTITLHGLGRELRMGEAQLQRQRLAHIHQHRQWIACLLMSLGLAKADTTATALRQGLGHRVVFKDQDVIEQGAAALPGPALNIVQPGVLMLAQCQVLRLHCLQPVGD